MPYLCTVASVGLIALKWYHYKMENGLGTVVNQRPNNVMSSYPGPSCAKRG